MSRLAWNEDVLFDSVGRKEPMRAAVLKAEGTNCRASCVGLRIWSRIRHELHGPSLRLWVLNRMASSSLVPWGLRWGFYRALGLRIERSRIAAGCVFTGVAVAVGRHTFVNSSCFFDAKVKGAAVTLGRNCNVAMNVQFITSDHVLGDRNRRAGELLGKSIFVGDGTWIGAGALILPGVRIGAGSVIAAGSVVIKDCEPDSLYAGVPARRIRGLEC